MEEISYTKIAQALWFRKILTQRIINSKAPAWMTEEMQNLEKLLIILRLLKNTCIIGKTRMQ